MHLEELKFDKNVSKFKQLHRLNCPAVLMTKKEKQTNKKFYLEPLWKSIWAALKEHKEKKEIKRREM